VIRGVSGLLLLAACGNLTATDDGVAFLDVVRPASTTIETGSTLQLSATALDAQGAPLAVEIRWASADSFLSVDPASGLVTAIAPGSGGRIQAQTGTGTNILHSEPLLLTVVDPPPSSAPGH
jgi:hypothetical protein